MAGEHKCERAPRERGAAVIEIPVNPEQRLESPSHPIQLEPKRPGQCDFDAAFIDKYTRLADDLLSPRPAVRQTLQQARKMKRLGEKLRREARELRQATRLRREREKKSA